MNGNHRLLVAALALGLTACGAPAAPSVPATPSPAVAASFGGTDRAWVEINIAMDEQLLPLLDLAATNTGEPALKDLSAQFKAVTEAELGTLRQLGGEAGLPAVNQHEGMPMPGMVTPELVTSAAAQRGAAFDTLLVKALREHLEQGRKLAGSEQTAGAETRTKKLADDIVRSRAATLEKISQIVR
ncbi:DUF305 domain-containing protein [Actinoplanes palleronii]|uniref:DUF305 domain-containing protein n=1 Tax=Actinoplanes palleronii TaxID=113570 RepID=A0ABQ4BIE9_9ACTN|nr:DUF305 domain-containing protein [Actinoplanes palleronii]GIE70045.1 DUF305 domain-containing protein [Actinoplanes palleronii]